jgi:hypothetical protein
VTDDQVLEALTADLLTALGTPESLGVGRILPSVGGEDFLSRDVEGQLPALGVADVDLERAENIGISQKKFKGKVGYELSVAAAAEGESSVAGRDEVRRVFGLVNKALDFRKNPFGFRFTFVGFSVVPHPRSAAVIGVARFETSAFFGNE